MAEQSPIAAMPQSASSPRELVCTMCWQELFSTPEFQQLCQAPFKDGKNGRAAVVECRYTTSMSRIHNSAAGGCEWCTFMTECLKLNLKFTNQEVANDPLRVIVCGHTCSKDRWPDGVGILQCSCTPPGNNQFELKVSLEEPFGFETAWVGFELFHDDETGALVTVTARDSQVHLKHPKVWAEARQWLIDCGQHECCPGQGLKGLPNRVIDVGSDPTGRTVKLVSGKGKAGLYVALSYCWGDVLSGVTNSQNLRQRWKSIDTQSLVWTIRNAIWATQQLGLSYLWVDAICIVQDSLEDKVCELEAMATIYQQAYVTIIASSSESASHGFLDDRRASTYPTYRFPFWSKDKRLTRVGGRRSDDPDMLPEKEPLERRAWAYQEELLSSRRLLFTERAMQYECRQHRVSLGGSFYTESDHKPLRVFANPESIMILPRHGPTNMAQVLVASRKTRQQSADSGQTAVLHAWQTVIAGYTSRSLTFRDDIFSALASIAETFQPHIGQRYIAGLWDGPMLPGLLLWYACLPHPPTARVAADSLAPSWSWASADYMVNYSGALEVEKIEWQGQLLCAHVSPRYESLPYGPVSFGYLRLQAKVRRAHYERSPNARWWDEYSGTNKLHWYHPGTKRGVRSEWFHPYTASIDPGHRAHDSDVFCLALCRSVVEHTGETQIHGLFVVETEEYGIYRRVGKFERMDPRDFDDCETLTLVLV